MRAEIKPLLCEMVARILNESAGANVTGEEIASCWPECREYRFMGALGSGGKVWYSNDRIYVNCYREDMTLERLELIDKVNERLAKVRGGEKYLDALDQVKADGDIVAFAWRGVYEALGWDWQ